MERLIKKNGQSTNEVKYECEICKDKRFIVDDEGRTGDCKCELIRRQKRQIEQSGLGKAFRERTLGTIKPINQNIKDAIETARNYVEESTTENLIISGSVGGGKTHLAIGVMLEFIYQGKSAKYIGYRELVNTIKSLAMDIENRNNEMNKYKNPTILVIDDLFKRSQTEADIALIYELINHRYLEGKRTIITTEKSFAELDVIDEAITSRLYENSEDYVINVRAENYRYKGQ